MCRTHARIAQRAARPAHYKAKLEARRRRVRQATPKWVDMREIERIYEGCPVGHEVDHIVPLKGENVSGLNVPWNLQYLSVTENRRKSNRMVD
jgi:5-methylcytosine-specific restriction endonuclease McrA